jgi:hypothetical protein
LTSNKRYRQAVQILTPSHCQALPFTSRNGLRLADGQYNCPS